MLMCMATNRSVVWFAMLGFVPGRSASEYRDHADKLLLESKDARVRQVCDWWQTPECWYAYSSRRGAEWWGKNGGPRAYCEALAKMVPEVRRSRMFVSAELRSPCFFCSEDMFKNAEEKVELSVMSCTCSTWYMHKSCREKFTFQRCFKCSGLYSDNVIVESLKNIV